MSQESSNSHILVPDYIRTHFRFLTHSEKWLYVCLRDICSDNGVCFHTLQSLSEETEVSISSLKTMIPHLHQAGLIIAEKKNRGTGGKDIWYITITDTWVTNSPQYRQDVPTVVPLQDESESKYAKCNREVKRIAFHLARAEKLALPATLTLEQWLTTLDYFNWKCAYCRQGNYEVFEHFMPLFHGGGTTANNCVPACSSCNSRKTDLHPLVFRDRMGGIIDHVQQYLGQVVNS